jgi:hypothetical protein
VPRTRVVVQGLGSIGAGLARAAALDPAFHLTGAVDVDPAKIGQPLASFAAGVPGTVAPALRDALDRGGGADVLLLATSSRAGAVAPADCTSSPRARSWRGRSSSIPSCRGSSTRGHGRPGAASWAPA